MVSVKNNSFQGTDLKYRGTLCSAPWTLCVGAGISSGLVPTWQELTREAINSAFKTSYDSNEFNEVIKETRWSLDALIQGVEAKLIADGKDVTAFGNLLEKVLYQDILASAKAEKLDFELIEALNNPRVLKKDQILHLFDFFESKYSDSTLLQLAKILTLATSKGRAPVSVVNFNADTLLYAVLDIFIIKQHYDKTGVFEQPRYAYKKSLRGIQAGTNVTPIYHCHGSISPMPSKLKKPKRSDSRDKLVFSEQDYLDIAGSMSTWAQTVFLFYAQSSRLVIIGHSLSDPNIRKWLVWSQQNAAKEFKTITNMDEMGPRHIWITTESADADVKKIQEVALLHLGIRICWIKSWSEVRSVLSNLLSI